MSNTIYSAILPVISKDKNKYNFVYQITEISTNMKYIGSHGTDNTNALKALKKYKSTSSNKQFKLNQKYNPLNYWYEILSYHETRDDATLEESRLHALYDVKCNPKYYNMCNQISTGFNVSGRVTVIDEYGNTSSVLVTDPDYLSGKLLYVLNNTIAVKDKDNNNLRVQFDDPRFLSGELVGINKGFVSVRDNNNKTFQVSVDDPRYIAGELVSVALGKTHTEETKLLLSKLNSGENNAMYGKTHTNESKDKMRIKKIGKKSSDATKQLLSSQRTGKLNPAAQPISINNVKFDTIKDASNILGITNRVISIRCKSNKEQWKEWIYLEKKSAI